MPALNGQLSINPKDRILPNGIQLVAGLGEEVGTEIGAPCDDDDGETITWSKLKIRGWIPSQAKEQPQHDPRNGLLLCCNDRIVFDTYRFFIRFVPSIQKFVFVNYCGDSAFKKFHGKAIALDIKDCHAPFASLFIIHEMRVRGFNPFAPLNPAMPKDGAWQDWILLNGVLDDDSHSFKRNGPPDNGVTTQPPPQFLSMATNAGGTCTLPPPNADVIAEILAATHAMPSWKACEMEGTSWTDTADENTEKYVCLLCWRIARGDINPNEK